MATGVLIPFLLASTALLAALAVLVAAKKLLRDRAERRSAERSARYAELLRRGSRSALADVAWDARRSARARGDLASALAVTASELAPARGRLVDAALASEGLDRAVARWLRSRSIARRGRALLLAFGMPRVPLAVLEPLLHDPDADVRLAAVRAIAVRRSPEAAASLVRALGEAPIPPERIVERLSGPWSVHTIVASIARCEPAVRAWLAEALGLAGDAQGAPTLMRVLETGGSEERVRACRALGRLRLRASVPALVRALDDPEDAVRAQAARALEAIPDGRALAPLGARLADSSWWVRANSARALLALGPPGRAMLDLAARAHRDGFARQRAAEALALEAMRERREAA